MRCWLVVLLLAVSLPAVADEKSDREAADAAFVAADWKAARAAHEKLVVSFPKEARLWLRLGIARQHEKDPGARAALEKAFALGGGAGAAAAYELATLAGKPADGLGWLSKAAQRGFSDWRRLDADPALAAVRALPGYPAVRQKIEDKAFPCKVSREARQLDFWVGRWDVFDPKGQQVGSSVIEKIDGDCVIFENWTSAKGSSGKSMNFYDTTDKTWHQVWVDDQGGVLRLHGHLVGKELVYEGESKQGEASFRERITFSPQPGGKVRQVWDQSPDEGKTWNTLFDGMYVPTGKK